MHAWINPFRVSGIDNSAISSLPEGSIITLADKFYLNPALSQVQSLVINGVRELIDNYDIDGIHFDDYFYPTADAAFDSATYQEYAKSISHRAVPYFINVFFTLARIPCVKIISYFLARNC